MTIVAAAASFLLKKSTSGGSLLSILKSKYLYIGGFLYFISALVNIWILQRMPYSVVIPIGGICYIWTMFISNRFLNEKINKGKIFGVSFILMGVFFLTRQ
ncbi:EamA family transporter [Treponema primitia]